MRRCSLFLLICLSNFGCAVATVRLVPSSYSNIVSAVVAAKTGDTISIGAGTYIEAKALAVSVTLTFISTSGLNDVFIMAPASGTTIFAITGSGNVSIKSLSLNGSGQVQGITVTNTAILNLTSVNITDCNTTSSGGGISFGSTSSLSAFGCVFSKNTATTNGGAIYLSSGSRTLQQSTLSNNAAAWGGAINIYLSSSTATVNGNTFDSNIVSSLLSASTQNSGGGAICSAGNLTVTSSTFKNNYHATAANGNGGGAIYNTGTMTVNSSSFTNNTSFSNGGGAVHEAGSSTVFNGCNFTNNTAKSSYSAGGAVYVARSPVIFRHCLFQGNQADSSYYGGALFHNYNAQSIISDCSFIQNSAGVGGALYALQNNIITVDRSTFTSNLKTSIYLTATQFSTNITVTNSVFTSNSQYYGIIGCTADKSVTTVQNCTFQSNSGSPIYISGASSSLIVTNSSFTNNTGVSISVVGSAIAGSISDSSFTANANTPLSVGGTNNTMTVSRCTLSSNTAVGNGAGILNSGTNNTITATNCVFTTNCAGLSGGAIYNSGSSSTIVNASTFKNNSASSGGGIYVSSGKTTLSNCSILGNWATNYGGGAYFAAGSSSWSSSIFQCNQAKNGSTYFLASSLLYNCPKCTYNNCSSCTCDTNYYTYGTDLCDACVLCNAAAIAATCGPNKTNSNHPCFCTDCTQQTTCADGQTLANPASTCNNTCVSCPACPGNFTYGDPIKQCTSGGVCLQCPLKACQPDYAPDPANLCNCTACPPCRNSTRTNSTWSCECTPCDRGCSTATGNINGVDCSHGCSYPTNLCADCVQCPQPACPNNYTASTNYCLGCVSCNVTCSAGFINDPGDSCSCVPCSSTASAAGYVACPANSSLDSSNCICSPCTAPLCSAPSQTNFNDTCLAGCKSCVVSLSCPVNQTWDNVSYCNPCIDCLNETTNCLEGFQYIAPTKPNDCPVCANCSQLFTDPCEANYTRGNPCAAECTPCSVPARYADYQVNYTDVCQPLYYCNPTLTATTCSGNQTVDPQDSCFCKDCLKPSCPVNYRTPNNYCDDCVACAAQSCPANYSQGNNTCNECFPCAEKTCPPSFQPDWSDLCADCLACDKSTTFCPANFTVNINDTCNCVLCSDPHCSGDFRYSSDNYCEGCVFCDLPVCESNYTRQGLTSNCEPCYPCDVPTCSAGTVLALQAGGCPYCVACITGVNVPACDAGFTVNASDPCLCQACSPPQCGINEMAQSDPCLPCAQCNAPNCLANYTSLDYCDGCIPCTTVCPPGYDYTDPQDTCQGCSQCLPPKCVFGTRRASDLCSCTVCDNPACPSGFQIDPMTGCGCIASQTTLILTTSSTSTSTSTSTSSSTTTRRPKTTTTTTITTTTKTTTTSTCPDSDGDGVNDCIDECPFDPSLQVKSTCGCQPQITCNCTLDACPVATFEGSISQDANVSVALLPNTTDTELKTMSPDLDLALGWGVISEIEDSDKQIKSVDPIKNNWARVITINDTMVTIEYHSGQLVGPLWPDPNLRIVLVTQIFLANFEQRNSTTWHSNKHGNNGHFIKFSVHINGDWGFAQDTNTLHVEFTVTAPVRERTKCDKKQTWKAHDTATSRTFRVFLANDTATTLDFLKQCEIDNQPAPQPVVDISDPVVFTNKSGWTTTVVFPSFHDRLYYDPSFALLLGYSNSQCDPLLAWILPAAFLGGAAVVIIVFGMLMYFPPTARFLMGERAYQIQEVRNEIRKDYRRETRIGSELMIPSEVRNALSQPEDDVQLKIITNAEEVDELFSTPRAP